MRSPARALIQLRPTLAEVIALGVLLFVLLIRPHVTGYDVWWHLRTGALLLGGEFPRVDPFSYTAVGAPWVLHEWLAQAVMAWLHARGGELGLALMRAGAAAATVGVVYTAAVRRGADVALAAVLAGIVVSLTLHAWVVRPLVFTTLLLAVTLLLVDELRLRRRRWPAFALPLVAALWVNLHGGFVVGPVVLAAVVLVDALRHATRPSRRIAGERTTLLWMASSAGASLAATLANPHGWRAWGYPLSYLGEDKARHQTFIAEWLPPTWADSAGFYVYAAAGVVLLISGRRRSWPVDATLMALLLAMALSSRRHVALFVVATAPAVAAAAQALMTRLARALAGRVPGIVQAVAVRSNRLREIEAAPAVRSVAVLAVGVIAALLLMGTFAGRPLRSGDGFPSTTLEALRGAPPEDRVIAQYRWGGYLLWQLPDRPVFIDGRLDVYPADVHEQYLDVVQLRPGWEDVIQRHDVRWILVGPDLPAAALPRLDPSWSEAARDPAAVLLAR